MSASLVGSEMCIRDRRGDMHASSYSTMPMRVGTRAGTHTETRTYTRTPVSYTHLTLPTICSV
eukprot:3235773-Alexandrium_andersonii.AAC.1